MQNGLEVADRDFFRDAFTEAEIRELGALAGIGEIFARRSPSLKRLGLAGQELGDDEMVRLMLQEPRLVRRPLMRIGDRLLVGGAAAAVDAAIAAATG